MAAAGDRRDDDGGADDDRGAAAVAPAASSNAAPDDEVAIPGISSTGRFKTKVDAPLASATTAVPADGSSCANMDGAPLSPLLIGSRLMSSGIPLLGGFSSSSQHIISCWARCCCGIA